MTDRSVSVRLGMMVRDYVSGAAHAERATDRLTAAQERLRREAARTGREVDASGNRLKKNAKDANDAAKYTALGLAAIGGAGAAVRYAAPALTAIAAAGATLPGILGGAAAAGGTLKIAMIGVSDAIGEVLSTDDPFERLSPNARKLVAEVNRLKSTLLDAQSGIQDKALAGLDADLARLSVSTLPAATSAGEMFADSWSDMFGELTSAATAPEVLGAFDTITATADRFFDQITERVQPSARAFAVLATSADPLVRAIGDEMVGAIDAFTNKVAIAKKNGSLDDFFAAAAEQAGALIDIATNLASIIGNVVSAGSSQNSVLLEAAESLDAYVDSGRAAEDIAGVMDTLTAAYEGMSDILGILGPLVRDALADPGTTAAIENTFTILAAGTAVIRGLFDVYQGLPDVVQGGILAIVALGVLSTATAGKIAIMNTSILSASTRLTAMGTAAVLAGSGLKVGVGLGAVAAGRGLAVMASAVAPVLAALTALQVIGAVFGDDVKVKVDDLGASLKEFAETGKLAGETARVFGEDTELIQQAFYDLGDTGHWSNFIRSVGGGLESLTGIGKLYDKSLEHSTERVTGLDSALADMVSNGNASGAGEVFRRLAAEAQKNGISTEELTNLLPQYAEAQKNAGNAAEGAAGNIDTASARTEALRGSFAQAAIAGKDLAATFDLINGKNINAVLGQVELERAYDNAKKTIDANGAVVEKGTHIIDDSNEKGRQNIEVLVGIAEKAKTAADAADKQAESTGKISQATPILQKARAEFIALATKATGSAAAARALADEIFGLPDGDVDIKVRNKQAVAELEKMGFKVTHLPDGSFKIDAKNAAALAKMEEAKRKLDALNGRVAYMQIRQSVINMGGTPLGPANAQGGVYVPRQRGGVRAAAEGLSSPEIAPPGTRYQWAEPETGGELFLPKRGINMQRGRDLLAVAASWYNGIFVPMAKGGIRAAASGLVNVAASSTSGAAPSRVTTRLDYIESYISAKNAVKGLNTELKENGRTFALASQKGRDNRTAVIGVIKAAQDAAQAKFAETGSVRAANAEYDRHIRSLQATLRQQKVSAATIRQLTAMGGRPTYDVASRPPVNSAKNVAFARSAIAIAGGIDDLRDTLSLNRATIGLGSPEGRENLGAILDFLGQAQAAAQARYEQTNNASTATKLYQTYVTQLRAALSGSGFAKSVIDSLVNSYGKITLSKNAAGGVYGGDGNAVALGAGNTLYQWREPGTGGEAFLPRYGDQRRGEDVLKIGAGWYGGTYVPRGAAGGGEGVTINNNLTVNPLTADLSESQLYGIMRQMDSRARVGRKK